MAYHLLTIKSYSLQFQGFLLNINELRFHLKLAQLSHKVSGTMDAPESPLLWVDEMDLG